MRFNEQTDGRSSAYRSGFNKPLIGQILGQALTRGATEWQRDGTHMCHQLKCQQQSDFNTEQRAGNC